MKLRSKIDHNSIKFKTWLYFILFAGFLMILLWVLQVLFLNNFYDVMKDEQTQRVAKAIQLDYQQKNSTKFLKSVESISNSNDMFIYVVSYDGKTMYFKPSGDATSAQYYSDQIKTVNEAMIKNNNESAYLRIKNPDDSKDVLAYGSVLTAKGKSPMLVYIFSPLWPVSSTIDILTNQLVYVTFISLLVACLISFYLSIRITRPIRTITRSAERLGQGEYGIVFRGGHYTEINNLADTLTQASIELEKSDMLQKDLIANVSHDLRTPLTMIKSYAEMIRDLSGNNPEKRDQHLQVIIDETDRLNSLVGDLLSISRMQSGKMVLERSNFNLTQAAESIINTYKIMEIEEGYKLNFNCKVNFIVNGDEEKIKQVISNLFTNAIKFAGKDKTVNVTLKRHGKYVLCKIEDHGVGIAKEEQDHVWERYYRASSNMARPAEGSGLGLSIVKEILTLHKADFGVDSTEGKGTTFWFELPYVKTGRQL
ncbi:MAG: HAMP domain-containing sensor histidine kinase [Bacillota bacterium]|nr:HAMP domain-containing sensor histidine kinase [Bacillota bacterium]